MARRARIVAAHTPHHVVQYGKQKTPVLGDAEAYSYYLATVVQSFERSGVELLAYCLMPTHAHFVLVPETIGALATALRNAHTQFARNTNRVHGARGHVWNGRFQSCPLDAQHALEAVRYVERNPVRAGVVPSAEDYPWSSAKARSSAEDRAGQSLLMPWPFPTLPDYATWLKQEDAKLIERIRLHTRTGRPCGDEDFVAGLESTLGRTLAPRKRGRPPKSTDRDTQPQRRDDWRVW